jgi:fructose-bisphosphate aldolase, class II
MPLASPTQFLEMLDAAQTGGYAYPAVNVTSSETLNAALRGFAEAASDGIVQMTPSGAAFASGSALGDAVAGARALAEFAHVIAERHPVLVALHTDHCPPERVDDFLRPLFAETRARQRQGRPPLFNSHMFDGSSLPLSDNLARARELLAEAAQLGLVLEVEIGVVGGEEDGLDATREPPERLYTTVEDGLAVADTLGTGDRGRYLLAATFGNVHGIYAPGAVKLRPAILEDLQDALADRYDGSAFQFVFHGGSGSSPSEIAEAVSYGVVKMNVDTDTQHAFTTAVAGHVATSDLADKKAFDPRSWGHKAEAAMARRVAQACDELGSAGRSLTR